MRSVIETLDGAVDDWCLPSTVMRWRPPESRPDWVRLRDMRLSTECDGTAGGDDLHPRAGIKPEHDEAPQTLTKVGHVE